MLDIEPLRAELTARMAASAMGEREAVFADLPMTYAAFRKACTRGRIDDYKADELCQALGMHPVSLWPDWYDRHTSQEVTLERVAEMRRDLEREGCLYDVDAKDVLAFVQRQLEKNARTHPKRLTPEERQERERARRDARREARLAAPRG